ncbi:membrane protein [Neosynechococcus sphagnicola sy1]|uniref:Membrane protein n=1 Tax=Neosynechococcus sphagnicola sy1 TaxID=1497020 RepID=A0A098TI32_9CYAN|nr:DUF2232 domain-containing protein [Neosynechococcus sphagnicola]KGF71627.1 membrane protein [Neosynechococcus sphagnicola sy1]
MSVPLEDNSASASETNDNFDPETILTPDILPPRRPRKPLAPDPALILVETAFLASAASLIWLVNAYFPLGPLLRLLFPLPIALVYLRWGNRAAWMAALVSGLLLSVLMGPARSILFVMPFGFLGVLLGYCWHRGTQWWVSISLGSLLGAIGLLFRIWLLSILAGEDLWLYVTVQIRGTLDWLFLKLGWLIQPDLLLVQASALGLVVFNSILYVFVVHLVAWWLLERLGNPIPDPPTWVQVLLEDS